MKYVTRTDVAADNTCRMLVLHFIKQFMQSSGLPRSVRTRS